MPKHVTITNYDKGSQLLIPTSEWTDSGIYTITVKNIVGQDSINIEVKVTGNCPSHTLSSGIHSITSALLQHPSASLSL